LWVTLPESLSSLRLFDLAKKENVAFVPGNAFYVDGSGNNTLRLNFSNSDEEKSVWPDGVQYFAKRQGVVRCFECRDGRIIVAEVKRLDRRTTRWIRYSARAITLVWVTCWISLLGIVGLGALTVFPLVLLLASLILLLSVSVAWRWEIIGAVVLVLEGLLILSLVCRVITVGHFPVPNHFPYTVMFPHYYSLWPSLR